MVGVSRIVGALTTVLAAVGGLVAVSLGLLTDGRALLCETGLAWFACAPAPPPTPRDPLPLGPEQNGEAARLTAAIQAEAGRRGCAVTASVANFEASEVTADATSHGLPAVYVSVTLDAQGGLQTVAANGRGPSALAAARARLRDEVIQAALSAADCEVP